MHHKIMHTRLLVRHSRHSMLSGLKAAHDWLIAVHTEQEMLVEHEQQMAVRAYSASGAKVNAANNTLALACDIVTSDGLQSRAIVHLLRATSMPAYHLQGRSLQRHATSSVSKQQCPHTQAIKWSCSLHCYSYCGNDQK